MRNKHLKKLQNQKQGILLLDFDGTLSPIVRRPHLAKINPSIKKILIRLSKNPHWSLAVVSGRDLPTVKRKVAIKNIIYAGNHGYEILMPGKKLQIHPAAQKTKPLISLLCQNLKKALKNTPGALVENKVYSASLHTRTLSKAKEKEVIGIFKKETRLFVQKNKIRTTTGKKILEIRPPAKWDKGKAILFILKKLKPGFPIYMGDDTTDEDAFRETRKKGLGIRVGLSRKTKAHFCVPTISDVYRLLCQFEKL